MKKNILQRGGLAMQINFEETGYVLVPDLIDPQTLLVLSKYYEYKIRRGEIEKEKTDGLNSTSYNYYSDPFGEVLLDVLKSKIEEASGKELLPTYSFFRVYQEKEQLIPHVDRESCEISVSINIAHKGENKLWMQYQSNEASSFLLPAGNAVVYKGCEAVHWRNPLKENDLVVQLMLHYVDKNGPNSHFVLDQRNQIGEPSCR